jgi:hypothetical protein
MDEGTRYGVAVAPRIDPFALPRIDLPRMESPVIDFRAMAFDIHQWTGWSSRALAEAVGTTHPTIGALLTGTTNVGSRNRAYLQRLQGAHEVIERIFQIAGRDRGRTAAALEATYQGHSAVEHLSNGQVRRAYLAATRTLKPRNETDLLTGSRPIVPGEGVADYLDTD